MVASASLLNTRHIHVSSFIQGMFVRYTSNIAKQ